MKRPIYLVLFGVIVCALVVSLFMVNKRRSVSRGQADSVDTLVVGLSADYPPFTYVQDDAIVGFDVDLVRELGRRMNKKIIFKDMPFDTLIPEIQLGNIMVMAGGMTPQKERTKRVIFTQPYISDDHLLVISRKDEPAVHSLDDLTNKEVIVNEGYTADMYMSGLSGPQLTRLPAVTDAFLALTNKRAFAFVTAAMVVKPFFDQYGKDKFNLFVIPDISESYALAVSKKYESLATQINQELKHMEQEGFIDQLKHKWGMIS